ncbi:FAS1-like dehydratase domain-containing protein [Aureimonas mangrovi]|uniref:FAS1-like dehydratase domain-containing protein n=1 Tax=Aureimonas mangrovi TaxID=2758041 RepID=UPI00163DBFD1|nr:MaoC family dehydratase N-terminal domain-containing protein [Aureimonas mangrovi]
MAEAVDIDHLKGWVGRSEGVKDRIEPRLVEGFCATLDRTGEKVRRNEDAPLCIHWCLAPPIVPNSATGSDGHPARGGFLPPVPLPRRMWAGGEIEFRAPLKVGDLVERLSTIESMDMKVGRSGRLVFVSVRHAFSTERGVAVEERQDIVYRDMPPRSGVRSAPGRAATSSASPNGGEPFDISTLALFRYSALTFNGHRIHYDRRYCIEEEGYPGLVVHGPLQATLLAHRAERRLGAPPSRFSYRGVKPLFDGDGLFLDAAPAEDGSLSLRATNRAGETTMEARALL